VSRQIAQTNCANKLRKQTALTNKVSGKECGKGSMSAKSTGPVKSSNSSQTSDDKPTISLPNGCDQDFVYYED